MPYKMKVTAKSDWEANQPREDLTIKCNPEYSGGLDVWGDSMWQWEMNVFHKPTGPVIRNNNSKLPDGTEVSALEAWTAAQPMKKIKDITKEDIRAYGPLSFRVKLVDDKRYTEEEVNGMTNEELSKLSPICKNLAYDEWTTIDAPDDTVMEYNWFFKSYQTKLRDIIKMGEIEEDKSLIWQRWAIEKKFPTGILGLSIPCVNPQKPNIPVIWQEIPGLGHARWEFATRIANLKTLPADHRPTKEEWVESLLGLHNSIVSQLNGEWEDVKDLL